MPWDFALILFVLGVLVPWRGAVRIRQILARTRFDTADRLALYASTIAFQWLAVGIVIWRSHARGLTAQHLALAFPEPLLTIAATLALSLLLGAGQFYGLRRLARLPADRQGFYHHMARKVMPQNQVEALAFIALAATVALCEELLYRGFVFAVLRDAARDSLLAAAVGSSAMFALAHLYQGPRGLASTFVVGLVFAGSRLTTASLVPSIAAHLVADLVAGLRAPRFLAESEASAAMKAPTAQSAPEGGNQPENSGFYK
jgi:membrane protease YdiL (CAAX protease family)